MMRRTLEEGHEAALEIAQQELQRLEPYKTAYMAGCDYHPGEGGGRCAVRFFGRDYEVTFPEIAVLQADGIQPSDEWIAFRELPDGLAYDSAFQGRSGQRLAREYGHDPDAFVAAAEALGGERLTFGDVSYMFRILPRIRMAVILHVADEEFGAAVNVLFDASAGHYLPTEDLAVLGGLLASNLIKAAEA
jgi:hypothetical protein